MIADIVYVNGSFVKKEDAKVSVFDHGFIYGDGAFEGLQIVNGHIFQLTAHLDRLEDSVNYLGFSMPMSRQELQDLILETARRNKIDNGYVRPIVTRGAGPLGIRNMSELGAPTVVIMCQFEKIEARRAKWDKGITAQVVSVRRIPAASMDTRAKTCNYINNIMAYLEAQAAGAETAIMLDAEGNVAEAYSSNLFVVKDGRVMTPSLGSILNGVTRRLLLDLCHQNKLPASEARLSTYDLVTADEVFECGTMAEVRPLVTINGRTIADGKPGPVTKKLHGLLREMMESGTHGTAVGL